MGFASKQFLLAPTVKVSFNANGGTGAKETVEVSAGSSYTLPTYPFSRSQYSQRGWLVNNTGARCIAGQAIMVTSDIALYAYWSPYYSVFGYCTGWSSSDHRYFGNGGFYGDSFQLPDALDNGYYYLGWSLTGYNGPVDYAKGAMYPITGSANLYAVNPTPANSWVVTLISTHGTGLTVTSPVYVTKGQNLTMPYATNGASVSFYSAGILFVHSGQLCGINNDTTIEY